MGGERGGKNGNQRKLPKPCLFVIKLSCTQAVPAGLGLVTFPCSGTTGSGEQGGLSTFYQQQLLPGLYEAQKLFLLGLVAAQDVKALTQRKLLGFKNHITRSGVWYRGGNGERTRHLKSGVLRGKCLQKSSLGYVEPTGESQRGFYGY